MLEEQNRFSRNVQKILTGVQACRPSSDRFLYQEALRHLAENYAIQMKLEETLAKAYLERKKTQHCPSLKLQAADVKGLSVPFADYTGIQQTGQAAK